MHTITGIGKCISLLITMLALTNCNNHADPGADVAATGSATVSQVTITSLTLRDIHIAQEVPATVIYIDKSTITAPISGYLNEVTIQTGSEVKAGQHLFTIETKEHRALQGDTLFQKTDISQYGVITVSAPSTGYITDLMQQKGDYVQEGTTLSLFTQRSKALIKAFVPFKMRRNIKVGKNCRLLLPDSSIASGTVKNVLNVIDQTSQSIQVLIQPSGKMEWPEGLHLKVSFSQTVLRNAKVLPRSAVLSNERLDRFWVMKMISDSIAVKVPVELGEQMEDAVQVIQPDFTRDDQFITQGAYGLPDTAKVNINKK